MNRNNELFTIIIEESSKSDSIIIWNVDKKSALREVYDIGKDYLIQFDHTGYPFIVLEKEVIMT